METLSIEIILGILAFITTTYLALLVFLRNPKSWTSRFFLLLGIVINSYIVTNYFSLHPPLATPEVQLFWIRVVMLVTSFLGPILLFLVFVFPGEKFIIKKRYLFPTLLLMVTSASISFTPLMFTGITYQDGQINPTPGLGFPIFLIDFAGLFFLSFIVFLLRYRHSTGVERNQYRYFFYGILLTFSLMVLTNVVFVILLKKSFLVFLGPIYPVILMAAIAYAIVKYNLFNIKLIATQAFIFILSITLFARIFISPTVATRAIDSVIFVTVILFGVLLIRAVKQEVKAREKISSLANELSETNWQLARSNEQLRIVDQRKSEFVSIVSHQLRTPITAIKGYASLLLEDSYGKLTKEQEGPIDKIFASSKRLADMVSDFLDISKIEQGKMTYTFTSVDLHAMLTDLTDEFRKEAKEKKLKLTFARPEKTSFIVTADEGKIRQIFSNILDNAIKYTQKGEVTISIEKNEVQGTVITRMKDSGIGLSQDDIHHLFGKFTRGSGGQKEHTAGSGLGLYVAKKMLEAQHGKIWIDSEGPGKGSTFAVELLAEEEV